MEKTTVLKLQFLMFIIYASNACFSPFLPVYFKDRHLTFTQIAIVFASSAIIGVIAQPVWGFISDKYLSKRNTVLLNLCTSIFIIYLFIFAKGFPIILTLIIINNIFMSGICPIMDAYTFDIIEEVKTTNYARIRLMASAAYAITNLALGFIIMGYGINIIFIIYETLSLFSIILLFSMKYKGKKNIKLIELKDIGYIFKNSKIKILLLTVFLMNAALAGGVNYMNDLIIYTKGNVSMLGIAWFVTCIFEVATFFIVSKIIKRFEIIRVYTFSLFLYGTKLVLDFLVNNANLIILLQCIEGIAFTLFITSSLEYLNANTKAKLRGTSISLYAAFGGLGAFTSSLLGGMLLNIINPSELFFIFGILCFIASIFSILLKEKNV
ncbi:MAG TPA: MFS transporter [Clostridiaceae bacterium]